MITKKDTAVEILVDILQVVFDAEGPTSTNSWDKRI